MNTFMVKVVFKKSEISGYKWIDDTNANLDCYIEVKAETLEEALDLVLEKYGDRKKYWVKHTESYMKLPALN